MTCIETPDECLLGATVPVMSRNQAEHSNLRCGTSRGAVVVVEEPAETLATANPTNGPLLSDAVDEFIAEAPVIALAMVVLNELQGPP
jgi:hypothetical protein